jgi:hypothetical protein
MSWKLIFGLSLFGLAMGFAPIGPIPQGIEPHLWLGIFVMSALVIAKRAPGRYFLHGLSVSLISSVWVTAAHVALFDHNVAIHGRVLAMTAQAGQPPLVLILGGPVVGIAAGLMLGALAWGVSKFVVSSHSEFAGW